VPQQTPETYDPIPGELNTQDTRLGVEELRFDCDAERRISLLTTFRKQRDNERTEVSRARAAMARCIAERHTAEEGS
jgi:hypothetical protein